MFTVEMKINGSMLLHIYGHNEGGTDIYKPGLCSYHYEYYELSTSTLYTGKVVHDRNHGLAKLVSLILAEEEKRPLSARMQKKRGKK